MSLFDVNKLYFDNSKPYVALSNSPNLYQEIDSYFESNMCDIVFVNIPRSFYGRYINQYLVKLLQTFFPSLVIYNYIYTIQILDSNINKKLYHLGISTNITPNVKQFMADFLNKNIFHDPETCASFIINIRLLKPIIPINQWIEYVHKYNNFMPYNNFFRTYTTDEKILSYNYAVAFNTETVYYPIQQTVNDHVVLTNDNVGESKEQIHKESLIYDDMAPISHNKLEESLIDVKIDEIIENEMEPFAGQMEPAISEPVIPFYFQENGKEPLARQKAMPFHFQENGKEQTKLKKKKKRLTKKEKIDRKNKQVNNNPFNLLR